MLKFNLMLASCAQSLLLPPLHDVSLHLPYTKTRSAFFDEVFPQFCLLLLDVVLRTFFLLLRHRKHRWRILGFNKSFRKARFQSGCNFYSSIFIFHSPLSAETRVTMSRMTKARWRKTSSRRASIVFFWFMIFLQTNFSPSPRSIPPLFSLFTTHKYTWAFEKKRRGGDAKAKKYFCLWILKKNFSSAQLRFSIAACNEHKKLFS